MVELLEVRPDDLSGDLASGVHKMLRDAFPEDGANEGDYYRAVGAPEVAMVLRDGSLVFGHLGLYTREAQNWKRDPGNRDAWRDCRRA